MASRHRRLWTVLSVVALIVAILLAAGAWLFGTESGARTALSMLSDKGGPIDASGVTGRLAGPLTIERLVLDQPDRRIVLHNVRLDWLPSALARGLLHITSLHAERLQVTSKVKQESEPATLPDDIRLPIRVKVDRLQVDRGDVAWGPMNVITLGALQLSIDYNHERYRLQLNRFAASSTSDASEFAGNLTGQATLATKKPYELHANFTAGGRAALEQQTVRSNGSINIDGSLADMVAKIDMAINDARVQGRSTVHPFSQPALGDTRLDVSALNLAAFGSGLPQTAIDANVAIAADGTGWIALQNKNPGLYSSGKMPLRELRAAIIQKEGQFIIDRMTALLGTPRQPAGSVTGSGRYRDGGLTVALKVDDLNLKRLHDALLATTLNGKVDLRHTDGRQQFAVDLTEPLGKQRLALIARGSMADERLAIDNAELRLRDGRLQASGHMALAGQRTFSAKGELSNFRPQDLGRFAQLPAMQLNGNFTADGKLEPTMVADLAFHIADSLLAGQPLRGDGQVEIRADRIDVPRLFLIAGDNRLDVQGALAKGNAQLTFKLAAPRLAQLGSGFAGALNASGTARGTLEQPRIDLTWNADRLRLPGDVQVATTQGKAEVSINRNKPLLLDRASVDASARDLKAGQQKIASLSMRTQFSPAPRAPLTLDLRATGIDTPQLGADLFTATIDGTTAQHTLTTRLNETGGNQNWTLQASGGLRDLERAARWQGSIERLDAQGRFVARLEEPAPLTVSPKRVQLDDFRLDANSARIVVDQFRRDAGGIVTRGSIDRINVAQLLKFADPPPPISTDLQMAGNWDVTIADTLRGTVDFRRLGGDVVIRSGTPTALGLRRLEGSAVAKNGQLQLQFNADGRQFGRIDINAKTATATGGRGFAPPPDAPLSGNITMDVPSLAWAGPMIGPTATTGGQLQGDVAIAGTIAKPRINGRVTGRDLRVFLGEQGIDLRQGVLNAEFRSDTLILQKLAFKGAKGGTLAVSGPVTLNDGNPIAQMAIEAENFMLLNSSDRKLVLSGLSEIDWADGHARITGAFKVDSGFFDIGREDMPRLSDDVVIVGREKKAGTPIPASVDLSINLGDDIVLQGRGIDAILAGQVRIVSEAGAPLRAQGNVRIATGTFSAYGRELAIERGIIRFNGPLDNPTLDILAMRRDRELDVEAGVAVRGTVLAPRITLVSEPSVPDAEKLSWLVLGRGLETVGSSEMGTLQDAAGKLLQQGALGAVQSRLASAFGLDDFRVSTSPDNLEQRIVTIGKRISARLYVSLERSLKTASNVLLLRYDLTEHLTIEAEAGARSALTLLYNITFD